MLPFFPLFNFPFFRLHRGKEGGGGGKERKIGSRYHTNALLSTLILRFCWKEEGGKRGGEEENDAGGCTVGTFMSPVSRSPEPAASACLEKRKEEGELDAGHARDV